MTYYFHFISVCGSGSSWSISFLSRVAYWEKYCVWFGSDCGSIEFSIVGVWSSFGLFTFHNCIKPSFICFFGLKHLEFKLKCFRLRRVACRRNGYYFIACGRVACWRKLFWLVRIGLRFDGTFVCRAQVPFKNNFQVRVGYNKIFEQRFGNYLISLKQHVLIPIRLKKDRLIDKQLVIFQIA